MPAKGERLQPHALLVLLVAAMWLVEAVNLVLGHPLARFGIFPRTAGGLTGIPLSPFLHAGPVHLLVNTGPLLVLGGLAAIHGGRSFLRATVLIVLAGRPAPSRLAAAESGRRRT